MTTAEFDVLDELYFLRSYEDLLSALEIGADELDKVLGELIGKSWVDVYAGPTEGNALKPGEIKKEYRFYHYLANKAGLLAHNSNF